MDLRAGEEAVDGFYEGDRGHGNLQLAPIAVVPLILASEWGAIPWWKSG